VVAAAVTRFMTTEIARGGLMEREMEGLGIECGSATIESRVKSGYFPEAGKMTVKLLGEKGTGRLLGAQIVGGAGAGIRGHVIATALQARMTVEDVVNLDLAYAPPFSGTWDAVHIAARQLMKRV